VLYISPQQLKNNAKFATQYNENYFTDIVAEGLISDETFVVFKE